jgi:hypothetical protein
MLNGYGGTDMCERKPIDYHDPAWLSRGITMIDCDPDWAIKVLFGDLSSPEAILASADAYFESMLTDSRVTDMAFAVFQQTSFVEASGMDWIYRKLARLKEDAKLSYTGRWVYLMERIPVLYRALEKFGLDWAEIAVEGCRKRGVRPWIYFRMNDLHAVDDDASLFHDPFFYEAKEKGYLNGNPAYGHPLGTSGSVENLYDFSHPEVRERLLSYLEEIILRYDAFGYELDFMRNIYCFDYLRSEAGYEAYMTDFIRRVKGIVQRAEARHGHPVELAVRLGQSVAHNLVYGFDVKTWVAEGLVDMLIPSCEEVCNSGVDVRGWRETVGEDVALAVGFDDHVIRWLVHEATPLYAMREDHVKAFAARYFNLGANGIYFNNYYSPDKPAKDMNAETVLRGRRTLVVTHQDIVPLGQEGYNPLPMPIQGASLTLNIGRVRSHEPLSITVGYDIEDTENVTVELNGAPYVSKEALPLRPDRVEGHYYSKDWQFRRAASLVRYDFSGIDLHGDFAVTAKGQGGRIVYLDVSVQAEGD